jgi:hypothetical protein
LNYAQSVKERTGFKGVIKAWQALSADQHQSLKNFLLHGVVANRREHRIANQNGNIIVPTRSILKGLANIQPTVAPTGLDHEEIHSAFVEQLGSRVTTLGHMLENPSNLGVLDGRVRFVDGGSRGLEKLTHTQPESIEQALGSLTLRLDMTPA